eukprot:Phypoly_transcript_09150.p1 GENE.Phypoly_transcript_09150~~Phypoly_transcript_09150.p1  ORF type:complete len:407 (+),score=61.01 Phypoly_transcript_09150:24-1223(+)
MTLADSHTYTWLEESWGLSKDEIKSLKPATRLREDLKLDDIALEELFYYLETQHGKKVSDWEVFGRSQTLETVAELFLGHVKETKIAFLFPGQGAQTVGMGKGVLHNSKAKALFTKAQEILGYDLLDLCLNGPQEKLDMTIYSQVAIFVYSLAELEVLREISPELIQKCSCVAGLSLGEYTALVAAGAMDFETGLKLVQLRATAMQETADAKAGGMMSVLGVTEETVNQIIADVNTSNSGVLTIANLLCPGNIVLSGDPKLCDIVAEKGTKAPYNAKATRKLAVTGAFHSDFMLPAKETLQKVLEQTSFTSPRKAVLCNLTGGKYNITSEADAKSEIVSNLTKQLTSPVRWEQSIKVMLSEGYNRIYELGPGAVLTGLMRHILRANPEFTDIQIEKLVL